MEGKKIVAREWFVVKTKPRCERQARAVLENRDIEIYLPEIPRAPGPRARPGIPEPLFPGYLFARIGLTTSDWLRARSAPGVAYFVGAAGRPSAVPDDLVEEIRGRVAAPPPPNPQPPFGPGDRVLITGGPFAGLEAIFEHRLSPAGRVRVFLQIVTQLLKVDLHVDQLRAPDGVG